MNEIQLKMNVVKHYYNKSRFEFLHGMDNNESTEKFFKCLHELAYSTSEIEFLELKIELFN